MTRPLRVRAAALAAVPVIAFPPAASAAAPAAAEPPAPVQAAVDYCGDQCADILPPGQNGNATLVDILAHQVFGTMPRHAGDQMVPYDRLLHSYTGLTDAQLDDFFNDASFGVPAGQVESRVRPRADVEIVRDRATGVPHITGTTREGTMFGAGYAAAGDRLFLIDVFRRLGRGELTSFAGGAPSNQALEQSLWRGAPYTEADLQAQIDRVAASGPRGAQALADVEDYVAGMNAYIDEARADRDYPGEYVLTGHMDAITQRGTIEHFTPTDVVGIASVVGLLFGGGGGGEVASGLALLAFQERYGAQEGERLYEAWRAQNDPESVLTVHEGEFPYAQSPEDPVGVALADPGSVVPHELVRDASGAAASGASAEPVPQSEGTATEPAPTATPGGAEDLVAPGEVEENLEHVRGLFNDGVLPGDLISDPDGMSNALLVAGEHTASGDPIMVAGPQTGYFSPQLLMVQELQGPGISARGASFPGLSFYVQIGRGPDYAWSPTSASQDITDTFALRLCEPDGSAPTTESRHYLDGEDCVPFEELSVDNSWTPTVADQTPAGSYRLLSLRTPYGLVESFATVDGTPVAYVTRRSTYLREVDSIIGFQQFNEPAAITSAADFQRAAFDVGYAFNWFYTDTDDIAFFNSGANPVRAQGTDPNLPIWSEPAYQWQDWNPADNGARYHPFAERPQVVNQDYISNWNNRQAAGYTSGWGMGAVHRGDLLDGRISALIAEGHAFTRASLVQTMMEAGVADLRAEQVLPELLRVIDSAPVDDPELAAAVAELRAWHEDGSLRREPELGAGEYVHAEAIHTLDAWWPLLVRAQFEPGLGTPLYEQLTRLVQINETPSGGQNGGGGSGGSPNQSQPHRGSAFQYGWWGYVDKDLRAVLGEEVQGGFGTAYCGGGELAQCRAVLLETLAQAAAEPWETTYPGDAECDSGDQLCADSIVHSTLGGITQPRIAWQNRPTYQAVHQFPARRTDPPPGG
ncbi:penicillin acylase family protein [Allonocardiopsis opalescens]|uniref:Penicillin amidase n=1 Tax=Allonocardiopsis opalescens TaxID=1144618 RepID=A0A2T0Q0H2_9ACTN|nr:penicillin acylase family protein [Allonocardiopsis opalescens]PRX97173.1 penicillin amidase [Allonocardiopsis opalescens]